MVLMLNIVSWLGAELERSHIFSTNALCPNCDILSPFFYGPGTWHPPCCWTISPRACGAASARGHLSDDMPRCPEDGSFLRLQLSGCKKRCGRAFEEGVKSWLFNWLFRDLAHGTQGWDGAAIWDCRSQCCLSRGEKIIRVTGNTELCELGYGRNASWWTLW